MLHGNHWIGNGWLGQVGIHAIYHARRTKLERVGIAVVAMLGLVNLVGLQIGSEETVKPQSLLFDHRLEAT